MTQIDKLLGWLDTHDGITTFEATLNLGICRVSERVRECERQGININHDPETDSHGHHIVRYRILDRYPAG